MNDESYDRQPDIERLFDPDNVSEWLQYPQGEFTRIIAHEIAREMAMIQGWTQLIANNENAATTFLTEAKDKGPSVKEVTAVILKATRITKRLLDTAVSYSRAKEKEGQ